MWILTWSNPERDLSSKRVPVTIWTPCFDMSWVKYLFRSVKARKVLAMCSKPLYIQKLVNSSFIHLSQLKTHPLLQLTISRWYFSYYAISTSFKQMKLNALALSSTALSLHKQLLARAALSQPWSVVYMSKLQCTRKKLAWFSPPLPLWSLPCHRDRSPCASRLNCKLSYHLTKMFGWGTG